METTQFTNGAATIWIGLRDCEVLEVQPPGAPEDIWIQLTEDRPPQHHRFNPRQPPGVPVLFYREGPALRLWPAPYREMSFRKRLKPGAEMPSVSPKGIAYIEPPKSPMTTKRLELIRNGASSWAGPFLPLVYDLCDAAKPHAAQEDDKSAALVEIIRKQRRQGEITQILRVTTDQIQQILDALQKDSDQ